MAEETSAQNTEAASSTASNGPAVGWYPDPMGDKTLERWWDGSQWCEQTRSVEGNTTTVNVYTSAPGQKRIYPMTETDRTLRLIAFIFNLLSTLAMAILIIPLFWMIPMTVVSYGIYKGTRRNTVAFGVCTLIFVSLVAGILLLISQKDDEQF